MPTSAKSRLVYGKDDALFGSIEKQQGTKPFGAVLDAGTGLHSLRWLATLGSATAVTAITADATMHRQCERECEALASTMTTPGFEWEVRLGNWFGDIEADTVDFSPESFDVILVDYLIGAMDGFSPYCQDQMIPKLVRYLKPAGRLYIVGLQPIEDDSENIVSKVRQTRDACILLAGHRCYREYPVDWIQRQIATTDGVALKHTKEFPILYRHATILKQINVARSKLSLMPEALRDSMGKVLDELEVESATVTSQSPTGRVQLGFDYVITAEKAM